jgi:hypothetical protein
MNRGVVVFSFSVVLFENINKLRLLHGARIVSFSWHNSPNPTTGRGCITVSSGDQMNMAMENCLSRRFSTIYTNIKAADSGVFFHDFFSADRK